VERGTAASGAHPPGFRGYQIRSTRLALPAWLYQLGSTRSALPDWLYQIGLHEGALLRFYQIHHVLTNTACDHTHSHLCCNFHQKIVAVVNPPIPGCEFIPTFYMRAPSTLIWPSLLSGTALEAIQEKNDSFFSQLPYKCYLFEVASVGD